MYVFLNPVASIHINVAPSLIIVIVNSRFLQCPQKRSHGNQLIHRHLSKEKSIGSGSDPESQAGRHTVRRLWWMVFGVETGREVGRREWIRIGFVEEHNSLQKESHKVDGSSHWANHTTIQRISQIRVDKSQVMACCSIPSCNYKRGQEKLIWIFEESSWNKLHVISTHCDF